VHLEQGTGSVDVGERVWNVTVRAGHEAREHVAQAEEQARQQAQSQRDHAHREVIMQYLQNRPQGALQQDIAEATEINKNIIPRLLRAMLEAQEVVRSQQPGDRASSRRWRRWPAGPVAHAAATRLRQGEAVEVVLPNGCVSSSTPTGAFPLQWPHQPVALLDPLDPRGSSGSTGSRGEDPIVIAPPPPLQGGEGGGA
jgi:hypothetical protein